MIPPEHAMFRAKIPQLMGKYPERPWSLVARERNWRKLTRLEMLQISSYALPQWKIWERQTRPSRVILGKVPASVSALHPISLPRARERQLTGAHFPPVGGFSP